MKVYIYTISFDGLLDKIGVASTRANAQQKVRDYLNLNEDYKNKPWNELVHGCAENNTGISIGEFKVNGNPITPSE